MYPTAAKQLKLGIAMNITDIEGTLKLVYQLLAVALLGFGSHRAGSMKVRMRVFYHSASAGASALTAMLCS